MENQTLEQTTESIAECRWCGEKYNLKQRQEQVRKQESERGITTPSHAADYCKNFCWTESDKAYCC